MLINSNVGSMSSLYQTSTTKPRTSRVSAVRSFKDEMALSAEALTFSDALKKMRQMSEVRQDKVDEYSAMLANGSYYASSDDIADSILYALR
ncbi:MAG: flagellar biosynthesis anti-sigma factor FlgM [Selenomonadaceae bacterium]|nr:flagellar biosynthesis anti-sigma factor FlgM [Selenomonadaceae bacterium]